MANEAGENTEQGNAGAGQGGTGKPAAGAAAGTGGGEGEGADKTYSQAELDAALAADRQASKRAAAARAAKPAAKSKEGGSEDDAAHQAELAAASKRAEEAEAQLRVRDARDSVEAAAKNAGFSNPSKIYRLIKDEISFDDAGKPDNVKDLITIAKKDFPEELGAGKANGSADGGAGGGGARITGGGMNTLIRRAAGYNS